MWLVLVLMLVACTEVQDGLSLTPQNDFAGDRYADVGSAGVLRVLRENPRYFTDGGGKRAIYLTGSHTWNNFQDWGKGETLTSFDFDAYLDFLARNGHNFIRLWVWEQAAWFPRNEEKIVIGPLPYLRTGPGYALDGKLRFDLSKFNPDFFQRLRERVNAAAKRGIYVSVMLFDGFSIELKGKKKYGNPWWGHPFNKENNINGVDGDVDGDGEGKEVHTLLDPTINNLQKAYIRKVVDTLSDLDNVLWEISNESHADSIEWQYEMIRAIKNIESSHSKQHPIGMTSVWPHGKDGNASFFNSPADWISPHKNTTDPYGDDPPASIGAKVVLTDTDHIWGIGGSDRWVWMSFFRGLNPIFMDPYQFVMMRNFPMWPASQEEGWSSAESFTPEWNTVRRVMGYARAIAERVDLAAMQPYGDLVSTDYCLASPGSEYLVFLPSSNSWLKKYFDWALSGLIGERVHVDLSEAQGTFKVEWVNLEQGIIIDGDSVTGGRIVELQAPFAGDAILHLKASVQ